MKTTQESNPLQEIKEKNLESIGQLNDVLNKTLGSRFGRAISTGFSIFGEYFLYALALCAFLFIFIMDRVAPFYLLEQLESSEDVQNVISLVLIQDFKVVVQIIIGLVAVLIFFLGNSLHKIRKYKERIRESVIVLKDVRGDIEGNNKRIDELIDFSDKMVAAANVVAHEAKIDKRPNTSGSDSE